MALHINKYLILSKNTRLLTFQLAHCQVRVVSLGILAQLLNQVGSLHLYLLPCQNAWILHCKETISGLLNGLFGLAVLKSAHSSNIHVELNVLRDRKALRSGRGIFGLSITNIELVELSIGH